MPWDVQAANQEAGALTKRNNALAGLSSNWAHTQQEYGLEGPWADASSNPYSRAALLQRSYDSARRGTTNSAGHKLYAGSFINAQNQNTHQFDVGRNELQNAYAQAQAQNIAEKQAAENAYLEELNEAGWNRINAGLQAAPEPMPAGGGGSGPGAYATVPYRGKKVKIGIGSAQAVGGRRQQIKANISKGKGK
ncbi:MAG TPA: hypothetical protein VFJ76_07755 [Solirubrobacterales bacterium]|nr:hypothetical protein [Solirubrobacterales bacterium]